MSFVTRAAVLTASLTASLALPCVAAADTTISRSGSTISVVDGGTVNVTSVTETGGVVSFAGTGLAAGTNCAGAGALVTCSGVVTPAVIQSQIDGGGWPGSENDTFDASALTNPQISLYINAGAGNDAVSGGAGDDTIFDTGGTDTTHGNGGDDAIIIQNSVVDAAPAADCGSGDDALDRDPNDLPVTSFSGCESEVPVVTDSNVSSSLKFNPVAGQTYSAVGGLSFTGHGSPTAFSFLADFTGPELTGWFLCPTALAPTGGDNTISGGTGCTLLASSAAVTVPANAVGKYLGFGAIIGTSSGPGSVYFTNFTGAAFSAPAKLITAPAVGAPAASNVFTGLKPTTNCKSATCSLSLNAPGPGTFTVEQSGNATVSAKKKKHKSKIVTKSTTSVAAAGAVKVPVKLTSAAKRKLKKSKKLSAKIKVTFAPNGGTAASKTAKVSYKLKKKKK